MVRGEKETSGCRIVRMDEKKLSEREDSQRPMSGKMPPEGSIPRTGDGPHHSQRRDDVDDESPSSDVSCGKPLLILPAGTMHSARMGPRGCGYLIGER